MLHEWEHAQYRVGSVSNKFCITPDSKYAILGTKDGYVCFYDIQSGEIENIIKGEHKA